MLDKFPLKSKKFIAYLIADFGWKALSFYVCNMYYEKGIDHYAFMVLVTIIVTAGFIQIGYILGQAALDKYTHVANTALTRDGENPPPPPPSSPSAPPPPKPEKKEPLEDPEDFDGTL
jgi:hypothetical protein